MAKFPLDGDDLSEIAKGMIGDDGNGSLPSDKLCKSLGKAVNRTENEVKDIFRRAYQEATGTDDDPFMSPPILIG